jgi:hypothetical protein
VRIALTFLAGLAACATTTPEAPAPAPAATPTTSAQACDPAGTLTVFAIPPPVALDWSTPNKLLSSVIVSRTAASNLVKSGDAAITHSIGHVNIQLDCGDLSIPLTGQTDTGGSEDWQAGTDGAGLLLRDTPGALDAMTDIGDPTETAADIAARQASGHLTRVSFRVNRAMCQRLKSFVDEYVARGAYNHYDGASRARRFEGAGCAIFGAGVVDVGGLLRRSLMTPAWARTEMIGSARIGNFLGTGHYRYGGNLVAVDDAGTHWVWPKGIDVPASATSPVVIYSSVLDAWHGSDDAPLAASGLSGAMQTQVPFTIYDPEMIAEWAEGVWQEAIDNGSATALGVPWTAGTVESVHEITYDASCVQPQTIAFDADNDDLFVDSDR